MTVTQFFSHYVSLEKEGLLGADYLMDEPDITLRERLKIAAEGEYSNIITVIPEHKAECRRVDYDAKKVRMRITSEMATGVKQLSSLFI